MSPLPFAPPPKDSSLYQQLESTTLQTLTADQLDTIKAKTFSQGTDGNEDEYRRLLLLGLAADQLSLAGPIARSTKIVSEAYTGSAVYDNLVFQPDAGETWTLDAASVQHSGGGGASIRTRLLLTNGTTDIELGDEAFAGNTFAFDPTAVFDGVKITSDVYIAQAVTGQTGGNEETSTVNIAVTRVR